MGLRVTILYFLQHRVILLLETAFVWTGRSYPSSLACITACAYTQEDDNISYPAYLDFDSVHPASKHEHSGALMVSVQAKRVGG
jgi:hypothetical protein